MVVASASVGAVPTIRALLSFRLKESTCFISGTIAGAFFRSPTFPWGVYSGRSYVHVGRRRLPKTFHTVHIFSGLVPLLRFMHPSQTCARRLGEFDIQAYIKPLHCESRASGPPARTQLSFNTRVSATFPTQFSSNLTPIADAAFLFYSPRRSENIAQPGT